MKFFYQYLTPGFLKKIDHFLLTNYPIVWSTQLHFFLFYSLVLVNSLAITLGLTYPVAMNYIPDYQAVFEVWRWSFVLAVGFLLFYAYRQSYAIKEVFSLREVLTRALIYLFCTASVFANTMTFPGVIQYRVKQIIPKQAFYDDLHVYAFEDYRANLWQWCYYNNSQNHMDEYWSIYDVDGNSLPSPILREVFIKYPKYQRILLRSAFNKDHQFNEYLRLCHTLDSLLPKPSPEEEQNYRVRKMEIKDSLRKEKRYSGREVRYWEVFAYLKDYREEVIETIDKHPKWQREFKDNLIQKIRNLKEFIFSLSEDLGMYARPLLQSRKFMALQKKYIPNYHIEKVKLAQLNKALSNIYQYHHGDFFFQTYHPSFGLNNSTCQFYGEFIMEQMKHSAKKSGDYYFNPFSGGYHQRDDSRYNREWRPSSLPVEAKTKIFSYYLDQKRVMGHIKKELPQHLIPASHLLAEAYLIFGLILSTLMLIAHTLTIRKFALLGGIAFGVNLMLYTFLFAHWTYEMRFMFGLSGVEEREYFTLIVPQVLLLLSIAVLVLMKVYPQNAWYKHILTGFMGIASILAGFMTYMSLLKRSVSYTDLIWNMPLDDSLYLYALLFVANVFLYWRYTLLSNRPRMNR